MGGDKLELILMLKYQGKIVSVLVVCSICWIKFQPLWFAIKKGSISLMDKASITYDTYKIHKQFKFESRDVWIQVHKFWENF